MSLKTSHWHSFSFCALLSPFALLSLSQPPYDAGFQLSPLSGEPEGLAWICDRESPGWISGKGSSMTGWLGTRKGKWPQHWDCLSSRNIWTTLCHLVWFLGGSAWSLDLDSVILMSPLQLTSVILGYNSMAYRHCFPQVIWAFMQLYWLYGKRCCFIIYSNALHNWVTWSVWRASFLTEPCHTAFWF